MLNSYLNFTRYITRLKRSPYCFFHVLSVVEFWGQTRGVLREAWYQVDYLQRGVATIREQPVFKTPPQNQTILQDFDATVDVADYYVQRLTSYLQVNSRCTIKMCSTKSS